ncbi:MAG TPA: hypothetical protein VJ761_14770 [Ktedonobacteraceae bacterium]|nr:hypothetical protein [Ktedonobacteraceae bacterium]
MSRNWPTSHEYDEALLNRHATFRDINIKTGHLMEVRPGEPLRLNGGGSQYVCVYRVDQWIVRCFASDPPRHVFPPTDIEQRYRTISSYLRRMRTTLPFLVQNEWIENGITINGTSFPFLKIPFIANSPTLGDFLSRHFEDEPSRNQQVIHNLAQEWLKVVQQLEMQQVAHGDLDLSNILVRGTYPSLSLQLIDFDGMYIPDFAGMGMSVTDEGHENFQPAQPGIRTFGPTMDRFAALVIYLSLSALEMNPALWERCHATERSLLLGAEDFERLSQSRNFPLLRQERNNGQLQLCLDELEVSINAGRMPRSLSEILSRSGYAPRVQEESAMPTSQYTGRALAIPLENDAVHGISAPIPSGMLPPTSPEPYAPWAPEPEPYSPWTQMPVTQSPRRSNLRIIAIIIAVILIVVAAILIGHFSSQPSQPPSPQSTPSFVLPLLLYSPLARSTDVLGKRDIQENILDEA